MTAWRVTCAGRSNRQLVLTSGGSCAGLRRSDDGYVHVTRKLANARFGTGGGGGGGGGGGTFEQPYLIFSSAGTFAHVETMRAKPWCVVVPPGPGGHLDACCCTVMFGWMKSRLAIGGKSKTEELRPLSMGDTDELSSAWTALTSTDGGHMSRGAMMSIDGWFGARSQRVRFSASPMCGGCRSSISPVATMSDMVALMNGTGSARPISAVSTHVVEKLPDEMWNRSEPSTSTLEDGLASTAVRCSVASRLTESVSMSKVLFSYA